MKKFIVTLIHPETKKVYKTKISYTDVFINAHNNEELIELIRSTAGDQLDDNNEPIKYKVIKIVEVNNEQK